MSKYFIGSPLLAKLNRGSFKIAMILFKFGFETRQERKGVTGGAGKASQNFVVVQAANLLRPRFHHCFSHRHLTVTGQRDSAISADQQNSCAAHPGSFSFHLACIHFRKSRTCKSRSAHPMMWRWIALLIQGLAESAKSTFCVIMIAIVI